MNKARFSTIVLTLAVLFAKSHFCDSEAQLLPYEGRQVTTWFWPVTVSSNESDETKRLAKQLARDLKGLGYSETTEGGPGCALHIDIDSWQPSPRYANFIIVLQPGGGLIHATDTNELRAAIEALNKRKVKNGNYFDLPVPIVITDLPIESHPRSK